MERTEESPSAPRHSPRDSRRTTPGLLVLPRRGVTYGRPTLTPSSLLGQHHPSTRSTWNASLSCTDSREPTTGPHPLDPTIALQADPNPQLRDARSPRPPVRANAAPRPPTPRARTPRERYTRQPLQGAALPRSHSKLHLQHDHEGPSRVLQSSEAPAQESSPASPAARHKPSPPASTPLPRAPEILRRSRYRASVQQPPCALRDGQIENFLIYASLPRPHRGSPSGSSSAHRTPTVASTPRSSPTHPPLGSARSPLPPPAVRARARGDLAMVPPRRLDCPT